VPIPSPIYAVVAPRALAWNHRAPPQGRRARRRRACCSLISMGEERCRPHLRPRLLARFSCRPELGPSSKTARLSSSSAAGRNRALGQRMERFRPAVPGPCSAAATRSESSHPAPVPPAAPHHESSRPVRIEPARRGRLLHRGGGAGAGEERGAMVRQGARGGGGGSGRREGRLESQWPIRIQTCSGRIQTCGHFLSISRVPGTLSPSAPYSFHSFHFIYCLPSHALAGREM
jgi:hypothetical protein